MTSKLALFAVIFVAITAAVAQSELELSCAVDEDQHGTDEFFTYVTCRLPATNATRATVVGNSLDFAPLRRHNNSLKVTFATVGSCAHDLPDELLTHLPGATHLYYENSPLRRIRRRDFRSDSLALLSLARNQIEEVAADTFHDLPGLVYLSLEANRVSGFADETFARARLLTTLVVRHNRIEALQPALFRDTPNMAVLYGEHNRIGELRSGTFDGCPHMEVIALRANRIAKVDVDFREFRNLTAVDLRGNADGCDFAFLAVPTFGAAELDETKPERDLDAFQAKVEENCAE